MVFFRNILTDVSLTFGYNFACSQSVANATHQVVVSIIAENPDLWQKEMTQLDETHQGEEFRVDFPLNLSHLDSIFDDIENEIGIVGQTRRLIVKAVVTTTAETTLGQIIEDEFSYEVRAILTAKTLELTGNLGNSEDGYREGTRYEATGRFDYEMSLAPNQLYETDMLSSEPPDTAAPATPAMTLGPGKMYFPDIIDGIAASFSYQFLCDKPISAQSQEVEITVAIGNPGKWSKSLVLMPSTNEVGSFTVSFPIDVQYFTKVIDAIGEETGVPSTSSNITLRADVRTIAQTDVGTINDIFTQTLGATLESNTLVFDEELSRSQSGTVGGTEIPGDAREDRWRTLCVIGLIVALLALVYFGWNQSQLGVAMVGAGEAEVTRGGKKYRQIMVDVEELPEVKPTETVISLGSLDDLARIADDLVKPMLHHEKDGHHTYCVIDSGVRYVYIVET